LISINTLIHVQRFKNHELRTPSDTAYCSLSLDSYLDLTQIVALLVDITL